MTAEDRSKTQGRFGFRIFARMSFSHDDRVELAAGLAMSLRTESERIAARQRNDAKGQTATYGSAAKIDLFNHLVGSSKKR
jgi:hypothetical protein